MPKFSRLMVTLSAALGFAVAGWGPPASANSTEKIVQITEKQAVEHGLPPLGFSVQYNNDMTASMFPDKDTYVRLSSRLTGGVLGFSVLAYQGPNAPQTLEKVLLGRVGSALTESRPCSIKLANLERLALGCTSGSGNARMETCAILLPAAADGGAAVVLQMSSRSAKADPVALCKNEKFQELWSTFHLASTGR